MNLTGQIKEVAKTVHPSGYIAGGAARYYWMMTKNFNVGNDVPADIDVFCRTKSDFQTVSSRLRLAGYKESEIYQSSTIFVLNENHHKVQLVSPYQDVALNKVTWGTPSQVVSNFGFTVEQFALVINESNDSIDILYDEHTTGQDVKERIINLTNGKFLPISYLWRLTKYAKKGYYITPKIVLELVKLWESYPEDRKEAIEKMINDQRESFGLEVNL